MIRFNVLSILGFITVLSIAQPSAGQTVQEPQPAEEVSPSKPSPRLRIGAGINLLWGLTRVNHTNGDVGVGEPGFGLYGLYLAPRYAVAYRWSLGVRGAVADDFAPRGTASSDGSHTNSGRRLWQLGIEGRYQPAGFAGPWVAAEVGVVAMNDYVRSFDTHDNLVSTSGRTQWAPSVGAAVGFDIWLSAHFTIAAEARATVMFFSSEGIFVHNGQYSYGKAVMVAPGLGGNFGY